MLHLKWLAQWCEQLAPVDGANHALTLQLRAAAHAHVCMQVRAAPMLVGGLTAV